MDSEIIDQLAAQLGVRIATRKKWRQRGRVSHQMRLPILSAAMRQNLEIDLAAFDNFRPENRKSRRHDLIGPK